MERLRCCAYTESLFYGCNRLDAYRRIFYDGLWLVAKEAYAKDTAHHTRACRKRDAHNLFALDHRVRNRVCDIYKFILFPAVRNRFGRELFAVNGDVESARATFVTPVTHHEAEGIFAVRLEFVADETAIAARALARVAIEFALVRARSRIFDFHLVIDFWLLLAWSNFIDSLFVKRQSFFLLFFQAVENRGVRKHHPIHHVTRVMHFVEGLQKQVCVFLLCEEVRRLEM